MNQRVGKKLSVQVYFFRIIQDRNVGDGDSQILQRIGNNGAHRFIPKGVSRSNSFCGNFLRRGDQSVENPEAVQLVQLPGVFDQPGLAGNSLKAALLAAFTAQSVGVGNDVSNLPGDKGMSGKKTAIHNIGTKHARTHMEKGKILRGVIRVEKVLSKGHTAHIVFKYNR